MEYQRWLSKILGFDFDIHYKPDLENKAADALSRKDPVLELYAVSVPVSIQLEEVGSEVDKDEELSKLKQEVSRDPQSHPDFSVVQGRLLQ